MTFSRSACLLLVCLLVVPLFGQPLGYSEPRHCIRLYCGLEDPADLIADIEQALAASGL